MQACGGGGGGVGWQLASQAVWFATLPGVPPGTTRHVGLGVARKNVLIGINEPKAPAHGLQRRWRRRVREQRCDQTSEHAVLARDGEEVALRHGVKGTAHTL